MAPHKPQWHWSVSAGALLLPALLLAACGPTGRTGSGPGAALSPATAYPPMLRATTEGGFTVTPLFSVGETIGDYRPPGILDGMVAFPRGADTLRIYVNHELAPDAGYPYQLENGTTLTGARVSWFDLDRTTRRILAAGPAYRAVRDRAGRPVTDPAQIHERGPGGGQRGFEAFCSSVGFRSGESGFVDDVLLTHEEATVDDGHPHGGTVWALDVAAGILWALPALGRGAWENSVALPTPDMDRPDGRIALLLGDDYEFGGAPLYLWLGRKQPGGNFIERNGLADGELHVWVAETGDRSPQHWHGSGTRREGRFVPVAVRDPARAGQPGHDAAGYLDDVTLRQAAAAAGAFFFSRPEDLHANPADPRQVVFASTGHGDKYPADDWGGLYLIEAEIPAAADGLPRAAITLLYDADETGDLGIRSPDNLVWAVDGFIYVQEDRATKRARFGGESGREASIWQFDPADPARPTRIAEIDRSALPTGATDRLPDVIGEWESSGIIDLSPLLGTWPGELVLLVNVQAHSVRDGPIGGRRDLVRGGQILLLTRRDEP